MKELIQFLPAYFARNFGITLQGILFVLANDAPSSAHYPERNES